MKLWDKFIAVMFGFAIVILALWCSLARAESRLVEANYTVDLHEDTCQVTCSRCGETFKGRGALDWGRWHQCRILAPKAIMPDPGVLLRASTDGSMWPSAIEIDWKYLCEHREWTERKLREAGCGR